MNLPKTRYAQSNGSYIAYQVFGDGPQDLVYASDLLTHVDLMWDLPEVERFLRRLASFCRVIIFDRRGTGISDRVAPDVLLTPADWAEDLLAVMDEVGSQRTAIFAERAGAVALMFAASHPERVSALILANTTARYARDVNYPCGESPDAIDKLHAAFLEFWGTEQMVGLAVPSRMADANFLRIAARFQRATATPNAAAKQTRYLLNLDVRHALSRIHCPTLILHRAKLGLLKAGDHARYLEEHISGSQRRELSGSDALVAFEKPDEVLGHIEEFLTGTRVQTTADRVLVTVLFTDMVGSTALAAELGDAAWRDRIIRFQILVRTQLKRFQGREVDAAGDGFFAVFDSPTRALQCARAIRDEAKMLAVSVRSGLHAGECEMSGNAVRGLVVHIGARIMAEAGADQIWVSSTVKELVAGSEFGFERRGEHRLKGVRGRWRLYSLTEGSADED